MHLFRRISTFSVYFAVLHKPDGPCGATGHQCKSGDQCIPASFQCDKETDCQDASDEEGCGDLNFNYTSIFEIYVSFEEIKMQIYLVKLIKWINTIHVCSCTVLKTAAPSINIAPPSNIKVEIGGNISIICEAVGTPTPIIVWRFEWGNIPNGKRVHVSSVNGRANLTITDARMADSGIYTCEAINVIKSIFASPNTTVLVRRKYSSFL